MFVVVIVADGLAGDVIIHSETPALSSVFGWYALMFLSGITLNLTSRFKAIWFYSYISAIRQSLAGSVVIVDDILPKRTLYLPCEYFAPLSPNKCLLAFSSIVLARPIALASNRFIDL